MLLLSKLSDIEHVKLLRRAKKWIIFNLNKYERKRQLHLLLGLVIRISNYDIVKLQDRKAKEIFMNFLDRKIPA